MSGKAKYIYIIYISGHLGVLLRARNPSLKFLHAAITDVKEEQNIVNNTCRDKIDEAVEKNEVIITLPGNTCRSVNIRNIIIMI